MTALKLAASAPRFAPEWLAKMGTLSAMTADDLRAARKAMDMTQGDLADALLMGKHGWQIINRMENGRTKISGPVHVAVGFLVRDLGAIPMEKGR